MGLPGGSPGSGGLFDTMEAMRKAWSSFALPPSMAPTIDPDELERRVAELKTVEQWLVMNLTMLRGTIQALEIQQHTLTALRAFGATGAAAMSAAPVAAPAATTVPGQSAASRTAPAERPANPGTGWPHPAWQQAPDRAEAPASPASAAAAAPDGNAGKAASPPFGGAPGLLPGVNPVAWWESLQQQFNQVAAAALANMPAPVDAGKAKTKAKAKAKTSPGAANAGPGRKAQAPEASRRKPTTDSAGKKRAAGSQRRPATEG